MTDDASDIAPPVGATVATLALAGGALWLGPAFSLAAGTSEPWHAALVASVLAGTLLVAGWVAYLTDWKISGRRLAASATVPPVLAVAWTLVRSY